MGLGHSPSILSDGLVLFVDGANNRSYSGSGTTWTNIVNPMSNGTLVSSPTYSSANGGYFTFDGSTNYVDLGLIQASVTTFTWAAWVKTSQVVNKLFANNAPAIVATVKSTGSKGDILMVVNQGEFKYYDESAAFGAFTVQSNKTIADNVWHYVAAGKVGNNTKLWVDGVRYANSTNTAGGTNDLGIRIASSTFDAGNYLDGSVAAVQMYNRQLTDDEISKNFVALSGRFGV
jgi:hypothetical protein